MNAVLDKAILHCNHREITFRHQPQPLIMHREVSGERQSFFQQIPTKRHAATRVGILEPVGAHPRLIGTFSPHAAKCDQGTSFPIDKTCIMNSKNGFTQCVQHGLNLTRKPNIILVRKENHIALGILQGTFKIVRRSQVFRLRENSHPTIGNGGNFIQGFIRRAVIRNDDFSILRQLGKNTFQLFSDIGRSIIGGDTDRNHELVF